MRQGVVVSLFVSALLFVPPLYADPPGGHHHGVPFAGLSDQIESVQSSVDVLQSDVSALQGSVDGLNAAVAAIGDQLAAMKNGLTVQTSVDTAVCASVPVQCANHSYTPADSSNHNPLRLFVQVVDHAGMPVNGLTLADFGFTNNFVPAGGGSAVICSEASCSTDRFMAAPNGLYTLFLDRGPAGNWNAGAYAGTVVVSSGDDSGASMVNFSIP
jgi:hypothetical protein